MILIDIRNKLEEIDSNVFYGAVDPKMKEIEWNYIVFNRGPLRIGKNRTGYSDYFDISVKRINSFYNLHQYSRFHPYVFVLGRCLHY